MNILDVDIYETWWNDNDPSGARAKSWARARNQSHDFTNLNYCSWCSGMYNPKKTGMVDGSLCLSCDNKKSRLYRRCRNFIKGFDSNKQNSGLCLALRKLINMLDDIDMAESMLEHSKSEFLIKLNIHKSKYDKNKFQGKTAKFWTNRCLGAYFGSKCVNYGSFRKRLHNYKPILLQDIGVS